MEGSTKLDSSRLSSAQKVKHPPKLPYNVPEPSFPIYLPYVQVMQLSLSTKEVQATLLRIRTRTSCFTPAYFVILWKQQRQIRSSTTIRECSQNLRRSSREVLSGSGTPLTKAFAKMGFRPTYKQDFADDYNYTVKDFSDLTDGVILGKIIELVTGCPPGSLISRLRNPGGDRLRKIGNVKVCLQTACDRGVDLGAVKAEAITGANKEAILKVLWRLVGVYVGADEERDLRRASLPLTHQNNSILALFPMTSVENNSFFTYASK
ncbi:unnamed protein product [Cylicocyclus nassatus]|uniref:Calponin-homology (CH) domain-containing protein n=1 Tax=Cylicocyclus nassatus TaxID=53992 RepID=A0AA36MC11_CYLNA|nr:unnamed protein product [Cylicocyclus nassatus]